MDEAVCATGAEHAFHDDPEGSSHATNIRGSACRVQPVYVVENLSGGASATSYPVRAMGNNPSSYTGAMRRGWRLIGV